MKKSLLIVAVVVIVVGGIYQYVRTNTYSYHLDKAEAALYSIEELIKGNIPIAFISTAYAQSGGVDEGAVARNAETAVDEIGMAQDIVDGMSDSANQSEAQSKVNETASYASEVLDTASEAVEGDNAKNTISNAQDTLSDIGKDGNQNTQKSFNKNGEEGAADRNLEQEQDQEQEQNQEQDKNKDPMQQDGSGHKETPDRDDDNGVTDAANVASETNEANKDTNDYDIAEKDAMERYKPLLNWKGDTPLPAETDKGVLGDTAEIVGDDGSQDTMQKEAEENLNDSPIDMEAMQEAIDKMMEQQ